MKTTQNQLLSENTPAVTRIERTRRSRLSRATALFASMTMALSPIMPSIAQAAEHERAQAKMVQAQKAAQVESKVAGLDTGVDSKLLEHNKRVLEAQQLQANKANAELTVVPETKVSKTAKGGTRYTSGLAKGEIGASNRGAEDNPRDNVFHIDINEIPKGTQWAWLSYYVNGVRDDAGVARSINDQAAEGGQLIQGSNQWVFIREAVNPDWLQTGQNIVRFAKTGQSYRVKDVSIDIEPISKKTKNETLLVVNEPGVSYDGKVLIKGYVTGPAAHTARVRIADHEFSLHNGGFSDVMDVAKLKALAGKNQDEASETIEVIADVTTGKRMERLVAQIKVTGDINADSLMSIDNPGKTRYASKDNANETLALGSARIDLTASAKADKHISVTALRQVDIPAMNQGMVNLTSKNKGYRFLPHGSKFSEPQTIRLGYDESAIPDGFTAHDIQTYYFSEDQGKWLALNRVEVDEKTKTIVSTTDHFTDMVNAIAKTPDMPETSALTPTTFKNMKAANPSSQVNMIQAPGATSKGDASLGYPLQLPAGRNGMTPSLAVRYDSSKSNSWMGMGWNLTVPSIKVETRWGVPRYDAGLETETYNFEEQQLAPVAHRSEPVARQSEKQFYPRVEGSFNKMIRHGSSPDTYYWEVTDKAGTRHFFGGSQNGLRDDAVLRTPQGNIGHWALGQSIDPYGNSIDYSYTRATEALGKNLYLKQIDYTGFNGSAGAYRVTFDHGDQKFKRKDVRVDARAGFARMTKDVLNKVTVSYQGQTIRSYNFDYIVGAFNKTLLKTITQNDKDGAKFNAHEFNYFNDVETGNSYQMFDAATGWNVPSSGFTNATSLSGGDTNNNGKHVSVTFGFWDLNPEELIYKTQTLGVNFDRNKATSNAVIAMVDINGDGLPDRVANNGGSLGYYPNLLRQTGVAGFGGFEPIQEDLPFYLTKSKSSTRGFEINPKLPVSLGVNKTKTTNKTNIYFSDVNADGLIDIVKDGDVYFNHLNDQGKPFFTKDSSDTFNPIATGAGAAVDVAPITDEQRAAFRQENPLHDTVRVWRAPYTGQVSVALNASLVIPNAQDDSEFASYDLKDGVRVTLEDPTQSSPFLIDQVLNSSTPASNETAQVSVTAGQKLYFRVHAIDDGRYDQVSLNPQILYTAVQNPQMVSFDANGLSQLQYQPNPDFTLSSRNVPVVNMPFQGVVSITGDVSKEITSDNVQIQVLKNDAVIVNQPMTQAKGSLSINQTVNVNKGDRIQLKVVSDSSIDWTQIDWKPVVSYTSSTDQNVNNSLATVEGKQALTFHAVPAMTMFQNVVVPQQKVVSTSAGIVSVEPNFSISGGDGALALTVKTGTEGTVAKLQRKQKTTVNSGVFANSINMVSLAAQAGDVVYVEAFADNQALADALVGSTVSITLPGSVTPQVVPLAVRAADNSTILGNLYRGWGQFIYNGNPPWSNQPIDASLLTKQYLESQNQVTGVNFNTSSSDEDTLDASANSGSNPANARWMMMMPDQKVAGYRGYDDDSYVTQEVVSATRFGDKNIAADNPVPSANARAVIKISKSRDTSYNLGGSLGPVGAGLTKMKSSSYSVSDFMDMNGDRYPDILGESSIQFTNMLGALSNLSTGTEHAPLSSSTKAESFGISGGYGQVVAIPNAGYGNRENNNAKSQLQIPKDEGGLQPGFNLGANTGDSDSVTEIAYIDMNGDGLPDRVFNNGDVQINLGYSFTDKVNWGFAGVRDSDSDTVSGGIGGSLGSYFNERAGSISGGINISTTDSVDTRLLIDVNSDGLPDAVTIAGTNDAGAQVALNTGSGFEAPVTWTGLQQTSLTKTETRGANAYLTACIGIPTSQTSGIKICLGGGLNKSDSDTADELMLADINGDGYLDILESTTDTGLTVRAGKGTLGKNNLLSSIKRPMGSVINLDYNREGNTFKMPENRWVLNKVEVVDRVAKNGSNRFLNTFSYEDGYYDRRERDFYGFAKVVSNQHDTAANDAVYRTTEQTLNNDNYYFKGLVTEEVLKDAAGAEWTRSTYDYDLKQVGDQPVPVENGSFAFDANSAFPALSKKQMFFYEGTGSAGKETSEEYSYDAYGNVTTFKDLGDTGSADDIIAEITYYPPTNFTYYTVNVPQQIRVTGGNGDLLRERSTDTNAQGDMTRISQNTGGTDRAVYTMDYDSYGNIKVMTNPANLAGERMSYTYEYENDLNTYVSSVTDSFGYSSTSSYDYLWGAVKESTDMNGHKTVTTYDNVGRVSTVTGPKELASGAAFTIQMSYDPSETDVPNATTKHHDPIPNNDTLDTITLSDSLGRVIQTKKDGSIFTGKGQTDEAVMIVSGYVEFDGLGRTTTSYYPTTEAKGTNTGFNGAKDSVTPTTTTYDVLDRALTVTLPDGAATQTAYGFGSDRNGSQQFETTVTDAEGVQKQSYTDVDGSITSIKEFNQGQTIWTSYEYDAINQLTKVTDDKNNITTSEYDLLGRRTALDNPDTGLTKYGYDSASNQVSVETANLRRQGAGGSIQYVYDYNRLKQVLYPNNPSNNVQYFYGAAGDKDAKYNRVGKVSLVQDSTGATEYQYGNLGETTQEKRTLVDSNGRVRTYVQQSEFDTWGRIQTMTYPDGEKVSYRYNVGGKLQAISGYKLGHDWIYVQQLGYDKFEQRKYLRYGNQTDTYYNYDNRRRLNKLKVTAKDVYWGQETARNLMENTYEYDKVSNIKLISDVAAPSRFNQRGTGMTQTFEYDDLYRLTQSNANYLRATSRDRFSVSMTYDSIHNIKRKTQKHENSPINRENWNEVRSNTYDNTYQYQSVSKPHAPSVIGDTGYAYDANGNMVARQPGNKLPAEIDREMTWREDNKLLQVNDFGRVSNYYYDHTGNRAIKNAIGSDTLYPFATTVISGSGSYTKHIFADSTRMVTKIGNATNTVMALGRPQEIQPAGSEVDAIQDWWQQYDLLAKERTNNTRGFTPKKDNYAPSIPDDDGDADWWNAENQLFFYHTDHLGSASYLTNNNGEVHEYIAYTPHGETLVEQNGSGFNTPYQYTGKELDPATNLYYYGARYYDPRTSVWQSTDPILSSYMDGAVNAGVYKSSNLGLYSYTSNNPTNLIDPDGRAEKRVGLFDPPKYTEKDVPELIQDFRKMEAKGREKGMILAPDNISHFLGNTGETRVISSSYLLQFDSIKQADQKNQSRLLNHTRGIRRHIDDMMSGTTKDFTEHFVSGLYARRFFEKDLYYGSGGSNITSKGNFNAKAGNSGLIQVTGKVNVSWYDRYDWDEGKKTRVFGFGTVSDEQGAYLDRVGSAESFDLRSNWSYTFQGEYDSRNSKWVSATWKRSD